MPLIPFLHSSGDTIFFMYVFTRVSAIFIATPLLSNKVFTPTTRTGLTMMITLLLVMVLFPTYRGENPTIILPELSPSASIGLIGLALNTFKEFFIGYIIGFIFSMLFEAIVLAGQVVGVMIGFSMAEILDPMTGISQPMLSQIFSILASLLVLVLDLHHIFFLILSESFSIIPIGALSIPQEAIDFFTAGSARLFVYGLKFVAFPFAILSLVTMGLGLMAKVMPEMNIFMVGFPLRILIGFYSLFVTITFFPRVLQSGFQEFHNLLLRLLHTLSS